MKRVISLILTAVISFSALLIPTSSSISVSAKSSAGVKEGYVNEDKWLSLSKNTTGARYFVDSKGNPVRLFGQARSQHHAEFENLLYSDIASKDALFEHYANYGCNFTRLAIENSGDIIGGEKPTFAQIQAYITKYVDPDVQAIIRNGMYVMLDVHMYSPRENTSFEIMENYAIDYFRPLAVELAKRYKDEPMVAVIELWNEPVAADNQNVPYEKKVWTEFIRNYFIDTINEIRKYDTRHVLMVSDHNAGWGGANPETWSGYYDKVDPVYRNTCYSIHASHEQLDKGFDWYKNAWFEWANSGNICLLFGEIETESGISTKTGIQNFCDMLSESAEKGMHFSGCIWRPHKGDYKEIWGDSGWAKKYASPAPKPTARYASEAEDLYGEKNDKVMELVKSPDLFGAQTGTGISMKPKLSATQYYEAETSTEIIENVVYKEGKYKLLVRACGNKGYEGDFIVGYRDVDGVVHQIARFSGKNTSGTHYYQQVDFTASKKIVSFVYFSCETSKKSAIIDRVYIIGNASNNETTSRLKADIKPVNKVIDLSGKSFTVATDSAPNDKPATKPDDGNDATSKPEDTSTPEDKNETTDNNVDINSDEQSTDKSDKTNTSGTTTTETEKEDYTLYIWIGAGLAVALAAFIVVCVIVVKKRNKSDESV